MTSIMGMLEINELSDIDAVREKVFDYINQLQSEENKPSIDKYVLNIGAKYQGAQGYRFFIVLNPGTDKKILSKAVAKMAKF